MADKEQKVADEGEGAFSFLMRTMPPEILQDKVDEAEANQARNYKFKEGKQNIIIYKPPRVLKDEKRFKYSDGIGYVGVVKEMKDGVIGKVEYPITYTETQFWELVGQARVHFPGWSPSVDKNFEILDGVKVITDTKGFKVTLANGDLEDRSKTRFEIDEKYERYVERKTWLKNKIEEVGKKEEAAAIGKATQEMSHAL
jgi:hypothetical protein